MRASSWLFLLVSFALGIASAFVVAYYTFDAKPVEIVDRGPTVKILLAKRDIPVGAEITAVDVVFADVPISEIPSKSLTNFMQVYSRRPAVPIPTGYPICEDLLMIQQETEKEQVKFLPAGTQIVSLEIEQIRFGEEVTEMTLPMEHFLSVGNHIDIRVLSREESQSELIERKNELLNAFMRKSQAEESEEGELVLENVAIHRIYSRSGNHSGASRQIQTLSLLLENQQAEILTAAAKSGRLRVISHELIENLKQQTARFEEHAMSDSVSDIQETNFTNNENIDRYIDDNYVDNQRREILATPQVDPIETPEKSVRETVTLSPRRSAPLQFRSVAPPEPFEPDRQFVERSMASDFVSTPSSTQSSVSSRSRASFITPRQAASPNSIRDEVQEKYSVANRRMTVPSQTENLEQRQRRSAEPKVVEIGLGYSKEFGKNVNDYSPFSTQSRLSSIDVPQTNSQDEKSPPEPLPLRSDKTPIFRQR